MTDLAHLARAFADDPLRWACQVRHDPARRTEALVHEDETAEVRLVCWMPGQRTELHDHAGRPCAVAVVRGALREDRLEADGVTVRSRLVQAGQTLRLDGEVHRVAHHGTDPAVSIHATPATR